LAPRKASGSAGSRRPELCGYSPKVNELYRRADCLRCTDIKDALEQLAIAFGVFTVAAGDPPPAELPEGARLPVLIDDEVFQGRLRSLTTWN
jgi:hypothetical protein